MKFEEAKVGMKVSGKGMTGTIVAIDKSDKSCLISFIDDTNLWFWERDNSSFTLKDIEVMSTDVKIPKFDTGLSDSVEFTNYLNTLKDKYNKLLNVNTYVTEVSISENGTIKVKDNHGNKAKAKCHKYDAFNLEVGLQLAMKRLAKKTPFVPKDGEEYYSILLSIEKPYKSTFYEYIFSDELNKAIGNYFRTEEEAEKNKGKIISRFKTLLKYAELIAKEDKG
jgi:hypothetical protein|nr:MAG TPA: hypothetical protein [Caudoviricetes sp.]